MDLKSNIIVKKPKWEGRVLLEICEIFSGGTPSTKNNEYWNGDIPWLSSGETRNNFIIDTERKITLLGVQNSSTRLAKKNDVAVASAGQGNTRGQVSFCLIDTYVNQSVIILRAKKKILPKFLFYNLKSRYLELRMISDAHSSRGSLPKNVLSIVKILLPALYEQKKIGKILYDLDTKIENLQKQNKILEQIAQAIFKSWFVDFDGQTKFVDSELGKIPKGWKISEINDVCKTFGGGTPSTTNPDYWNGRIHWLVPSDLTHSDKLFCVSSERKITDLGLKQCASQLHPESSILMTSRATIGAFAINKMPTATNQGFIVSRPNDLNHLYYLFLNFSNRIDEFVNNANGSTFLEISRGIFRELPILVPPADTLNAFHYKIKSFFEQRLNNEGMIETLTKIRDILLPKLVSGKIRV